MGSDLTEGAYGASRSGGDSRTGAVPVTDSRQPVGNQQPVGFWHAAAGELPARRTPLPGSMRTDVCIVGGGYTGLWTAWALARNAPSLAVTVLEAEHVGFGASGRNGGWLSGLMPGDRATLATRGGVAGVIELQRRLTAAVGEVVDICACEGIDADIVRGGTLAVATTAAQLARLRSSLAEDRRFGVGAEDAWELGAVETSERVAVAGARGGVFSPHCARVQPAKLVRGLADAAERRGVVIHEATRAVGIEPGLVRTPRGTVSARWVIRATEGYTAALPGLRRAVLPMNSSIAVTDPLPSTIWDALGWSRCETLRDAAHAYSYLQRTADGRISIGGRGVPYRYASRIDPRGGVPEGTVAQLEASLHRLFPQIDRVRLARAWSGVLGVARDWCPGVGVHGPSEGGPGLAWAGGYVGDGVTTSYLAGLTLADIVTGRDSPLTALPWVGHVSRRWEPEPLRWSAVRALYWMYRAADRAEAQRPDSPRTSRWAALADAVSGKPG